MKTVFKITNKISDILGVIAMALIVFMMVYIVAGVLSRKIFNAPFSGAYEVVQIALAVMTFAAFSFAQTRRRHVSISVLVKLLPEAGRFIDNAIVSLLGAATSVILAVSFFQQGKVTLASGQYTQTLFIPLYPVYFVSCLFMGLFAAVLLVDVIRSIMAARGDQECREDIQRSWV